MLQIKFVQKLETHFIYSRIFAETCLEWEYEECCGTAGQDTGGNIMLCVCFTCLIN